MAVESEQTKHLNAAFRKAMTLYVGRGKAWSAEEISEATGISCNTLYAYGRGETAPSFASALTLMSVMDSRFANKVLSPTGLTAHRVDEMDNDTLRANAEISRVGARLADMLRDGRFDHMEKAEIREHLFPVLRDAINQWLAAEEAAPSLRAVGSE